MNDPERDAVVARWLAGDATPEELADLTRRAAADANLRRHLAALAAVHGLLAPALNPAGDAADRARFTARIAGALVPDRPAFTARVTERLGDRRRVRIAWLGPLLAGAAVLVLGLLRTGEPASLARISGTTAAVWTTPPPAVLAAGSRLDLAQGLVEIALAGRGTLVVEGPAVLELVAPLRAVLHRGRVVMHATPAGHGYRIDAPGGTLEDLGTRFAVNVAADGATEAHVLEGTIAAIPTAGVRTVLNVDQACRFGPAGIAAITADPDAFYTALPPAAAPAPMQLRWPLDEGAGDQAGALVQGWDGPAEFRLQHDGGGPPPAWIPGKRGGALAFDGLGAYAESGFPGIAGGSARTVACWVRVPLDFTPADGFAILSWGHFGTKAGAVWQVSINPLAADGLLGRIRVGTNRGLVVGTTDLRDGAWHHLAVVLYGGDRPAIGTHVLVYVDGQLESLSRATLHPIDTRIVAGDHGVWLGRNIAANGPRLRAQGGYFRGAIDDVVIVGAALDPAAIRHLRDGLDP